jgi:hypothetical protein
VSLILLDASTPAKIVVAELESDALLAFLRPRGVCAVLRS